MTTVTCNLLVLLVVRTRTRAPVVLLAYGVYVPALLVVLGVQYSYQLVVV